MNHQQHAQYQRQGQRRAVQRQRRACLGGLLLDGFEGVEGCLDGLQFFAITGTEILATGGQYFRARDGEELQAIKATLDTLEPVEQQPTQARPALALYSAPLALALVLSMLLVIQERWPNNALQRLFNKWSSKGIFLQQHPEWRQRLKRLRLRRRR